MKITPEDYFGPHSKSTDITAVIRLNAANLLTAVNACLDYLEKVGVPLAKNPKTGTYVSGEKYGGYRPQDCPIGAALSAHKQGLAVDVYDPQGKLDQYLLNYPEILEKFGLYIEHPSKTLGWCHLTIRAPKSGKRIFYP